MGDTDIGFQGLVDVLGRLALSQEAHSNTTQRLGEALGDYFNRNDQQARRSRGSGPKVKEPGTYDGDQSEGKLDDHIRELENWVAFYTARNQWENEQEKIDQASTYLNGKIHRLFTLRRGQIHSFPGYVEWLRTTFRDPNEDLKTDEQWEDCSQGKRSVMEYASEIIALAAKSKPPKSEVEQRKKLRAGLDSRIQAKLLERMDTDNMSLNDFIALADRYHTIVLQQSRLEKRGGQAFAITQAPTRQYDKSRPKKDSPGWKPWCRQNNACFECGGDHLSRDCSKRPARRRNGPYPRRPFRNFQSGKGNGPRQK